MLDAYFEKTTGSPPARGTPTAAFEGKQHTGPADSRQHSGRIKKCKNLKFFLDLNWLSAKMILLDTERGDEDNTFGGAIYCGLKRKRVVM